MFKNILVPVSSEHYSKKVIERSIFIAETFQSNVHILYIIEETPHHQMEKYSDAHLTYHDRTETHQDLLKKQRKTADDILFKYAEQIFERKNINMKHTWVHGEFSTTINNQLKKNNYDIIIMEYEKGCMIDYRALDEIKIPIWIEGGGENKSILAVCSNLAPNQKVPTISTELSKIFKWKLSMLYVTDTQDTVEVDINGKRSTKKPKRDLIFKGQNFVEQIGLVSMNK